MATSTPNEMGVRDLGGEYPAALAGRLTWLETRLGLDHERILELAGIERSEQSNHWLSDWSDLAVRERARLEQAEGTLLTFLSQFCNDADKARAFLEQVRSDSEFCTTHLPFISRFPTAPEKNAALLGIIHETGSDFIVAVATFLASGTRHPAE